MHQSAHPATQLINIINDSQNMRKKPQVCMYRYFIFEWYYYSAAMFDAVDRHDQYIMFHFYFRNLYHFNSWVKMGWWQWRHSQIPKWTATEHKSIMHNMETMEERKFTSLAWQYLNYFAMDGSWHRHCHTIILLNQFFWLFDRL